MRLAKSRPEPSPRSASAPRDGGEIGTASSVDHDCGQTKKAADKPVGGLAVTALLCRPGALALVGFARCASIIGIRGRLRRLAFVPELQRLPEALDGLAPQAREDVAVDVQRDADLAVPEPFLHHFRVDALPQHQRRVGVPHVVEADGGQGSLLAAGA